VTSAVGYGFLVFHSLREPISLNASAIAKFLFVLVVTGVAFLIALVVLEKLGLTKVDEKEASDINEALFAWLRKKPWRLLLIPSEDGLFLLPLLYIGINPISAAIAGLLFAAAHYPLFPWKYCIPKGITYFFVALSILPYGIWSVIAAHLIVDVSLFGLNLLGHLHKNRIWRRLFRVLRTE
jgi:hypothetical protein